MNKIRNKLTVQFFTLILLITVTAFILTVYLVSRQFHLNLSQRLSDTTRGIQIELKNLEQSLLLRTRAISQNDELVEAFKKNDRRRVLQLLEEIRKLPGADIVTGMDENGIVLGRGHRPVEYGMDISESRRFLSALEGEGVAGFVSDQYGMGLEAFVPVKDGDEVFGVLKTGKILGYEWARYIKAKYGLDVIIFDKDRLQASTFSDPQIFVSSNLEEVKNYVGTQKESIIKEIDLAGDKYFVFGHPIISKEKLFIGEYFLALSQRQIHNTLYLLTTSLLVITILLILISLYISHRISSTVGKPLETMSVTALEVAEGDLSKKVEVKSRDEIGLMAESFNTMIDGLRRSTTSIHNLEAEIEKREEVEQKLFQSNEDYQRLLDNLIGSFMYRQDPTGKFIYASKSIEDVLGYRQEEFLEDYTKFLTDHPVNKVLPDRLDKALKGEQQPLYLAHVLHKDGSGRWLEISEVPVYNENGDVIRIDGVAHDITKRQEALLALRLRNRAIFQSSNSIIISKYINPRNNPIIFVNPAFENTTGYSLSEVQGTDCKFLQGNDRDQPGLEIIRSALENHVSCQTVVRNYRKDGTMFWNEVNISPVFDEPGNLTHFVGVTQDITERKLADEERERLLKTIKIKNSNLQSVVYIASHDLRSPLVNIEGFANELTYSCRELSEEIAGSSLSDEDKQRVRRLIDEDIIESIKYISAGAGKMSSLLEGLLQVSRAGTKKIEIKLLDMNKMMRDIQRTMGYQIKTKGVEMTIENLPDCVGDKSLVNQVFSNIVGNSLKYLDPQRPGKIHISGSTENGRSVYCVADNGIGISSSDQEKIFDIFHRISPDDAAGGEGLGLSIVTRILDRLDGRVRVESELGEGSKFFIALPKK